MHKSISPRLDAEMILNLMLISYDKKNDVDKSTMPGVFAQLLSELSPSMSDSDLYSLIAFGIMIFERDDIKNSLGIMNFEEEH